MEIDLWGNLRDGHVLKVVAEYLCIGRGKRVLTNVDDRTSRTILLRTGCIGQRAGHRPPDTGYMGKGLDLARIRFEGGLTSETSFRQAQVELARDTISTGTGKQDFSKRKRLCRCLSEENMKLLLPGKK